MKKYLILALSLLLLVSLSLPALAAEYAPEAKSAVLAQPRYTDVMSLNNELKRSGNSARVSSTIYARKSVNFSVSITIQQKINSRWKTLDTFSKSGSGTSFSVSGSVDCADGQVYQAIFKGTAGADSINATRTLNT